jgi:chaperonin GroES
MPRIAKKRCPLLPTGDRLVIEPREPFQQGVIVLVKHEPPSRGRVAAWGPDTEELKVGDEVVFKKRVATVVTVADRQWLLVRESDVLCRVEQ